jgi:hypothetical protein
MRLSIRCSSSPFAACRSSTHWSLVVELVTPRLKVRLPLRRAALHSLGGHRLDFAFDAQAHPLAGRGVTLLSPLLDHAVALQHPLDAAFARGFPPASLVNDLQLTCSPVSVALFDPHQAVNNLLTRVLRTADGPTTLFFETFLPVGLKPGFPLVASFRADAVFTAQLTEVCTALRSKGELGFLVHDGFGLLPRHV